MTGKERAEFEKYCQRPVDKKLLTRAQRRRMERRGEDPKEVAVDLLREMTAYWVVVDENGDRLFREEDIEPLREKSAAPLERIMERPIGCPA